MLNTVAFLHRVLVSLVSSYLSSRCQIFFLAMVILILQSFNWSSPVVYSRPVYYIYCRYIKSISRYKVQAYADDADLSSLQIRGYILMRNLIESQFGMKYNLKLNPQVNGYVFWLCVTVPFVDYKQFGSHYRCRTSVSGTCHKANATGILCFKIAAFE